MIVDGYHLWNPYFAKHSAEDDMFDSIDSNLQGSDPTFCRFDPGGTFRIGLRWTFGVE